MKQIILAPTPKISNEVSMKPVTFPEQFHKGKVRPSLKFSFNSEKVLLKLISGQTSLPLVWWQIQNY